MNSSHTSTITLSWQLYRGGEMERRKDNNKQETVTEGDADH